MSASATCISVIPSEADIFVPKNLKRLWFDMQKNFFEFQENNLKSITYESLLERLEQLWKIKMMEGDDGGGEESSYKVKPLLTSKLSRSNRKSQSSKTKAAAKLMNDMESLSKTSHTNRRNGNVNTSVTSISSNSTAIIRNSDIKESYTFDSVNSWTVLTTVEDLKSVGYKRTFKIKKIQGFIPFKTPKFPKGVRVLKTTNINEKVRLN